ncbi:DUF1223 domain-containing protein [Flavobacterium sp. MC2016-06]|jgi:hypothetical protein|uniref:DUF1223 domain-containing protein n=1 Tax=Flavobacterium sp. MC2016-06 TaxID=2676308 RepID=UPI0012BAC7FF|nr:DUF1223 domain-containing protein [Flavobacterium sp. MC2016-06]MBU3860488.1 DUF1223 domain-containing protein [Flavobacterium sp. MC2016-06]
MKKIKLVSILTTLLLFIGIIVFGQNNADKKTLKGFVVLELFTSEGCSSCPPADELMGSIQNEYKDAPIYILSYHVDYWDRQGWKDIFSNADYTKRQYDYAKWLGKEPVYTPQVVVNGKKEYIGSDEVTVRNAIVNTLSKPAIAELSLETILTNNKLEVNYKVNGISKNSRLLVAVLQKSAKSNVKRGENAHRILSHYQIVKNLQSFALKNNGSGIVTITAPKEFNTKDFEVIGFVQDINSGAILGAAKAVNN